VNLLSYKERTEDGFFLLLVAPKVKVDETQVIAKDVIVVLDTSGSMEGEKLDQAKDALRFILDHLNAEDRFNIVQFNTRVNTYADSLQPARRARDAAGWVRGLQASGSTDIDRAMLEALAMADRERPTIVIFLTDGLPTAGTVEPELIINDVKQAARSNMRVFTFGVGDDVNTVLLDTLARELRGTSAYVRPGERIDEQVSAFYSKVSTPVLADVKLTFQGVRVDDTYPDPLPDLFAGTQLVLVGRYTGNGPATVTLEGTVNGKQQRFVYEDLAFRAQGGDDFIAPLWATRKIGYLLNQIRLHGESQEAVDEIVELSIRYGIVTPYTSFLVEEPNQALSHEGRRDIATQSYGAAATAAPAPASGAAAVQKAQAQGQMEAAQAPAAPSEAYAQQVQIVGDRAFVLRDGVWTDTTFDTSTMTTTKLDFGSDAFFQLLADHPEAGRYFALGEQVIVVIDGVAYETVASGGVSQLPTAQAPAATPEAPVATAMGPVGSAQPPLGTPQSSFATPQSRTTTPPAGNAGEPYTLLSADVVEGVAPLAVNFSGELVGGSDNNRDYYCVESTFDFGDGGVQSAVPDCAEWTAASAIQRQYNASYVYDQPGTYRAAFSLANARSEPLTIVVRAKGEAPAATPAPARTGNATPQGTQRATGGLCAGPLGLMLVPLLGLALAGRRT
jgi:Ca-activated chloride channel family protein